MTRLSDFVDGRSMSELYDAYWLPSVLAQLDLDCHFESIQKLVDVQISCAGRTDENSQRTMGIIDLENERWLGPIDAFSKDAHSALAAYASDGALAAPFCSDEISAQAYSREA